MSNLKLKVEVREEELNRRAAINKLMSADYVDVTADLQTAFNYLQIFSIEKWRHAREDTWWS